MTHLAEAVIYTLILIFTLVVILVPSLVSLILTPSITCVCLIGEILGYQGENDKMIAAIETAKQRFDALEVDVSVSEETTLTGGETNPQQQQQQQQQQSQRQRISRHSLASVYHKLATSYLTTRELIPLSLPLLDKALSIAPGGWTFRY